MTRHPRLVHDEMEAIFGVPSSLNTTKRGYSAGVATHVAPESEFRSRMGSPRLWIGIALMVAALISGAGFVAWLLLHTPGHRSVELASTALDNGSRPTTFGHTVAHRNVAAATPAACAGHISAAGTCIAPAPAPAPPAATVSYVPSAIAVAPIAVAPAAAADAARATSVVKPQTATVEIARCEGTGYKHMATCPPAGVLKADSALSAAYASAISANVDPGRLAQYSQRWSQLRETASADPDTTTGEFADMTSQLDALTVAAASRKK